MIKLGHTILIFVLFFWSTTGTSAVPDTQSEFCFQNTALTEAMFTKPLKKIKIVYSLKQPDSQGWVELTLLASSKTKSVHLYCNSKSLEDNRYQWDCTADQDSGQISLQFSNQSRLAKLSFDWLTFGNPDQQPYSIRPVNSDTQLNLTRCRP